MAPDENGQDRRKKKMKKSLVWFCKLCTQLSPLYYNLHTLIREQKEDGFLNQVNIIFLTITITLNILLLAFQIHLQLHYSKKIMGKWRDKIQRTCEDKGREIWRYYGSIYGKRKKEKGYINLKLTLEEYIKNNFIKIF